MRRNAFLSPIYAGEEADQQTGTSLIRRSFLMLIGIFGFTMGLTLLYHAMRGVMRLGGFVASGGPYAISHPAPDWVWIFPVSILGSVICIAFNQVNARRIGGVNLMVLLFPAVFLSLGWNFLEFALHPPGGVSLAWGWLICAVLFALMGGVPLLFVISSTFKRIKNPLPKDDTSPLPHHSGEEDRFISRSVVGFVAIILNLAAIPSAIYLAIRIFATLAK
jgi:hypothetical protein